MPRRDDTIVFEGVSDITPEEWVLTRDELYDLIVRRFNTYTGVITTEERREAAQARVKAWLDDHNVYPKRADLDTRIKAMPHEGLISLLSVLGDWRAEQHPLGEDGELE